MGWVHTTKWPRYLVKPPDEPAREPHAIDPHHNPQGDWVCRTCGYVIVAQTPDPPPEVRR